MRGRRRSPVSFDPRFSRMGLRADDKHIRSFDIDLLDVSRVLLEVMSAVNVYRARRLMCMAGIDDDLVKKE